MLWWHWLVIGLILVALEMAASGGFYVIFFGIAALAIAGLHVLDCGGARLGAAGAVFGISIGSLLFFRGPLLKWMQLDGPGKDVDSLVGDIALPLEDIPAGAVGRAELRGTVWSARNQDTAPARARRAVQGGRRRSADDFSQTRKRALMTGGLLALLILTFLVLIIIAKTAVVVPQQSAYVVERLGRFHGILNAGFHVLLPFVDVIRYRHSLKEIAVDIPAQVCITRDNVQVGVDGVLYLKVLNPERASYGISDYMFAISQLAQTTLRSEVGKIDLDRTFEERTNINTQVVSELDKASEAWGVKVLRYEIKNITPPADILAAMEKQMRAEREKRAVILTSEGTRDAAINTAEGMKQEVIKQSEARKLQQINEAEGRGRGHHVGRDRDGSRHPQRRRSDQAAGRPGSRAAARRRAVHRAVRRAREERQHDRAARQCGGCRSDDCARDEIDWEESGRIRVGGVMRVGRVVVVLLAAVFVSLRAEERVDHDIYGKIRQEAATDSQILRTTHVLTDRYGPRPTGSPNLKAAGEWAITQLQSWGLQNGRLEPWDWGYPGWLNERLAAHIISPVKDQLVAEALAWTPGTNGPVKAAAVQITLAGASDEGRAHDPSRRAARHGQRKESCWSARISRSP